MFQRRTLWKAGAAVSRVAPALSGLDQQSGTLKFHNFMARDVPIAESYRGVMPFLISDTLRTLLLLFFPGVCLWLVQYLS